MKPERIRNDVQDNNDPRRSRSGTKNVSSARALVCLLLFLLVVGVTMIMERGVGLWKTKQKQRLLQVQQVMEQQETSTSTSSEEQPSRIRRLLIKQQLLSTTVMKDLQNKQATPVEDKHAERHHFDSIEDKIQWLTNQWTLTYDDNRQPLIMSAPTTSIDGMISTADDSSSSSSGSDRSFFSNKRDPLAENNHSNEKNNQTVVHVLQIGNVEYQQKYWYGTLLNQKWSECAGYQYHLIDLEEHFDCMYTNKVLTIQNFFQTTVKEGEWMIFIDLDAYFQSPDCNELDRILAEQQSHFDQIQQQEQQQTHCEVMFHMCGTAINSGLMLFRKTPQTSELMEAWYQHQISHGFCIGPADQWALQEMILEYYKLVDNVDDCLRLDKGPATFSSRGACSIKKLQRIKRQSEEYFFQNTMPTISRSIEDDYLQYMERHSHYSMVPLLGTRVTSSTNNDNVSHSYYNNVCVFDCLSKHPLQCKGCKNDYIANQLNPNNDGTQTCLHGQAPLFHHAHFPLL